MKTIVLHRWLILSDTVPGRRIKTTYPLTAEDALARDPDAKPLPGTMEVRSVPETEEERLAMWGGHSINRPR